VIVDPIYKVPGMDDIAVSVQYWVIDEIEYQPLSKYSLSLIVTGNLEYGVFL
jgi:hypothetical protein